MIRTLSNHATAAGALVLSALLVAGLGHAPGATAQERPDFLFKAPRVTVGVNVGWAAPRAGSDLFAYTTREFTVDEGDFQGLTMAGEVAYRVTERLDVTAELGWSRSEILSEYRDFEGTDDLPIRQTTTLERLPFTFNVKAYLNDRGRSVSRFAWVPATWSPWVGAGAGWMWHRWEQEGEFIDFSTLDIFRDRLVSEGTDPMVQVMGGADVSVTRRVLLTGQLRYSWASGELDTRFYEDFEDLDLAGFQATAGIKIRL